MVQLKEETRSTHSNEDEVESDEEVTENLDEIDLEEDEVESEGSDWNDENHSIIRAKWQMDGAKTLDECIEYLKSFIAFIEELKKEGWELTEPVDDDYGHIKRDPARAAATAN
jgi:hypothetical protein